MTEELQKFHWEKRLLSIFVENNKLKIIPTAIAFAVIIMIIAGFVLLLIAGIKNSDSYQAAITYIESSYEIRSIVGDITELKFRQGSISTYTGGGNAEFTIRVIGERGSLNVRVILEKNLGNDWEITEMWYQSEGR
jgi:hypothetical protein